MSQGTNTEGLFIVSKDNSNKLFHDRKDSTSFSDLKHELRDNILENVSHVLTDFISHRRELSFFTINCQNIRAHVDDQNDDVLGRSNILVLSETHLENLGPNQFTQY